MDYEKAYKEALNWMRSIYPTLTGSDKEDAEHYFPELAESEDERIRKELKEAFEAYDIESKWNGIPIRSIFAWLEKQKESLHIPETCEENANSFIDGIIEVRSFQRGMEEGRRLEKQKEQKPNYCLYGGYPNVGRCRWCYAACSARLADVHTDEEKEYIRTIKSIISDFIRDKKPENLAYYQRICDWLDGRHVPFSCGHENGKPAEWAELQSEFKNINEAFEDGKKEVVDHPDKYGLTKQKSWSEEDERMLRTIISDGSRGVELDSRQIAWLKSLRPSWKPSKEQMKALQNAVALTACDKELARLYNQLKKL